MFSKFVAFILVLLLHTAALLGLGLLAESPLPPALPSAPPTLQAVWIDTNPPVAARAAERPPKQPPQQPPTPPEPPKKPPIKKVERPKIATSAPKETEEKQKPTQPEPAPKPQPAASSIASNTSSQSTAASGGVVGGTSKAEQGAATGADSGGGAPAVELPSSDASYLNNPKPVYPPLSRRRNEAGKVLVRVHVNADGSASNVRLHKSSGFPALDQSALEAVAKWRFVPGKRGGQPVAMDYNVPVKFSLKD